MSTEAKDVENLLQEVWMVVSRLHDEEMVDWFSRQQWTYATQRCQQVIEAFQKQRLTIGVAGPSQAGKSSFINALLGISLLQTEGKVNSTRLITIHYTPRRKGSKLKLQESSGKVSTGLEGVRQRLHELLTIPSVEEWQLESPLEFNAAFCKALEGDGSTGGETNPNGIGLKLDLIEIPSMVSLQSKEFLKQKIQSTVQDLDGFFFVMDLTKLRTAEESQMVEELKEILTCHSIKRIFILVCKVDRLDQPEDIDIEETKTYVCDILHRNGLNFHYSQVFIMSPKIALLSRLVLVDKNDQEVHQQFGNLVWGRDVDSYTDKSLWKAKATSLLELSGVPHFEEQVLEFFQRNFSSLKQLSLFDTCLKVLDELMESGYSFKGMLSKGLNEMRLTIERLKSDLAQNNIQLTCVKSGLLRLEQDVVIKVREVLNKLKNSLLSRIGVVLSWDIGVEDKIVKELPPGWLTIRQDFLALIHHQEMDPAQGADLLKELHEEIVNQLQSEMEITWKIIETMIRDQHFELVLHTNEELDQLSKFWETITNKDLNVQIEPADIKLLPLTYNHFTESLPDLLKICMSKQAIERSFLMRLIGVGKDHVYVFDGGSIREYFENLLRNIVDESISSLTTSIKKHLSGQIACSEEKLRIFSESYHAGVEASIEERTNQITSSTSSMKKVIGDLSQLKKTRTRILELSFEVGSSLSLGDLVLNGEHGVKSDTLVKQRSFDDEKYMSSSIERPKYIPPPRSRLLAQDPPSLTSGSRTISLPVNVFSELVLESPKVNEEEVKGTVSRSGSWNSTNWAAAPPIQRSSSTANNNPSNSEGFSPRSTFFRGFDKATRGRKGGRGTPTDHRRIGSWT